MEMINFSTAIWATSAEDATDSSKAVVGLLDFDENRGFELTIPWGTLLSDPVTDNDVRISSIDGVSANAVYGFSQTGYYLVLKDVTSPGHSEAYPGFEKQVVSGSSLLVSRQLIEPEPKVTAAYIELPGAQRMDRPRPFRC